MPPRLPKQHPPTRIAADYYKALRPVLAGLQAELDRFVEKLHKHWPDPDTIRSTHKVDARDPIEQLLMETNQRLAKIGNTEQLMKLALRYGQLTAEYQKRQLVAQARAAVGVDLNKARGLDAGVVGKISTFAVENAQLVQGLGPRLADDLARTVAQATVEGSRWETVADLLAERAGVSESRAKLIARDQMGKLFGEVNAERQQNLGVTRYVWRTMRDNRVREEHEVREGDSYDWSDPPEDGHPGEAVNCRCYAEPDFSDLGLVSE